jgi:hypothetical protein
MVDLMKFLITMQMSSRAGYPVHQLVGEHDSPSLAAFTRYLSNVDFVVVDEYYRDEQRGLYPVGPICINTNLIGKVKAMT